MYSLVKIAGLFVRNRRKDPGYEVDLSGVIKHLLDSSALNMKNILGSA